MPNFGRKPPITGTEDPHPYNLGQRLGISLPSRRTLTSGPLAEALNQLMSLFPLAGRRIEGISAEPMPTGTLGELVGNGIRLDPSQIVGDTEFGDSPVERLLEVLKHETAHVVGYDERDANQIGPKRRSLKTPWQK
jgi:hypothetical protein